MTPPEASPAALDLPPLAPRARRRRGPRRVLVVRLSAVGDVLHALPAVHALAAARPDVAVDWLVEDRAAALLEGHPDLAAVHVVPRARWRRTMRRPLSVPGTLLDMLRFVARLLRRRYDAVVDLQGNLKSGLWSAAAGAPVRVGLASGDAREGNGFFVNRRVAVPRDVRHRVERALRVLGVVAGRALPFAGGGVAPVAPDGDAAAWVERALGERGLASRGFVVLHPGTSRFGAFKRWPTDRFAALAARIVRETGAAVVLTGAPGEEPLVEAVAAAAGVPTTGLVTPNLATLAALLARARAVVAADTGPLHLAAGLEVPVLGLFGPKDAEVYGPFGRRPDGTAGPLPVLVRDDVGCRPCAVRWCPDPVCMSGLEVDDVFARVRAFARP
ncbi:MAG: glycosyltransferase family 9 protein [Planctomycetota bacterium]